MPVQTIECHIATVLMKRFLDGENLPSELLHDLEKHVKACSSCRELLNNEKLSMEEVLDGQTEPKGGLAGLIGKAGLKPATAGGFATAYPTEALVGAARTSYQSNAPGMAAFKNPKVLFLSGALAVVLIAMSTILRDPTALLGTKAGEKLPVAAASTEDPDGEAAAGAVDEHGSEEGHGDEGHGEESHEDSGHGDELHAGDAHGEDDHGGDDHGEDGHGAVETDSHAADSHGSGHGAEASAGHGDDHAAEKPKADRALNGTSRPGTVVPGEKTINENNVVLIGGDEPKKPTSHSTKTSNQAKNSGGHTAPKKSTGGSSAKRTTSKSSSGGTKKSGIKVYDQNGKPIK